MERCTQAIVFWSIGTKNETETISKRGGHHTDRGSMCAALECRRLVVGAGGRRSMSRRSHRYGNAVAESAFRTIEAEVLGPKGSGTMGDVRRGLFGFIEGFYNHERRHSTLE